MKPALKYIELKSGYSDNGPAWIGIAEFSKSGRTVYFNGKALKSSAAQGIAGNYYDLENGDEYWVSGVKKNGTDRHWAGGGKIMIDRNVVDLYLSQVNFNVLDKKQFEFVDILPTDKQKFSKMENESLNEKEYQ
ncbi:mannose-1-phosphate guanylyltransferase [Dokdonia sp.]|uniref:mannose-1-phosphate guanylyltransferase n=1 Tax=Dokdonia sp. TaxID=2024995 RepID=UPI0032648CD9